MGFVVSIFIFNLKLCGILFLLLIGLVFSFVGDIFFFIIDVKEMRILIFYYFVYLIIIFFM